MNKSRNWCFTLNNYTDADVEALSTFVESDDLIKYICAGREVGESGTPHLQGFLVAKNQIRLSTVRTVFDGRAHWEIARGTASQAIAYCEKDGDFMEFGARPLTQGQKGDCNKRRYQQAWDAAVDGRIDDIDADIKIRHYNTLKRIRLDHEIGANVERLPHETRMEWFYGPSGTGKSRTARDRWPSAYLKMCNKWWDGYSGQEVVLIEDFDVKHAVLIHHLKIWADIYPFLMEVKGGATQIRPKLIVVTSNYHPSEIWTEDGDLQPVLRRFQITHFASLSNSSATAE